MEAGSFAERVVAMDANTDLQLVLGQLGSTQIARLRRHASLGDPAAIRALRQLITASSEPRSYGGSAQAEQATAP
jgi:hypothetical protein